LPSTTTFFETFSTVSESVVAGVGFHFVFAVSDSTTTTTTTTTKLRICIGGGGGFIGSHLARRLLSQGHHVICAGELTM
jgi:hypothetical protein